jgi:hypothetical protein
MKRESTTGKKGILLVRRVCRRMEILEIFTTRCPGRLGGRQTGSAVV